MKIEEMTIEESDAYIILKVSEDNKISMKFNGEEKTLFYMVAHFFKKVWEVKEEAEPPVKLDEKELKE